MASQRVKKYLEEKGIEMYSTHNEGKAVVVERFNKTMKTWMWKYFSANNTTRYLDILPALLTRYTHSIHRSIGMTPHDASQKENDLKKRCVSSCKASLPRGGNLNLE